MNNLALIMRESRTVRFLIPAGIMLLIFGIVLFVVNRQNQNYLKTEAVVTNSVLEQEASVDAEGNRTEASYTVSVKYTVDGKEYESELGGLKEYKAGEKMTIYYNPDDPVKITMTKSMVLPIVIIAAGIAAIAGGIVSGMNAIKKG